jgi:hypothetical protein
MKHPHRFAPPLKGQRWWPGEAGSTAFLAKGTAVPLTTI